VSCTGEAVVLDEDGVGDGLMLLPGAGVTAVGAGAAGCASAHPVSSSARAASATIDRRMGSPFLRRPAASYGATASTSVSAARAARAPAVFST
jgi:hypothetical protein